MVFHVNMSCCEIHSQFFSLQSQILSSSFMNLSMLFGSSVQLSLEFWNCIVMRCILILSFISMILLSLVLKLVLLLKTKIKITDRSMKFRLIICMRFLLLINLRSDFSDSAMELTSSVLRHRVLLLMLFDICSVIVDDGALCVQSNYGCLQSFYFNLLVRNCHLSGVELLLENNFWF